MTLVAASVPSTATFADAAAELRMKGVSAVAVLEDEANVVGLFGEDEVLRGLFPRYLVELRHTAFTEDDRALLASRARQVRGETIEKHMRTPITVELDSSAMHVAERFLHCDLGALAVVERGRFVGMLGRVDFCRAVISRFASEE